MLRELEDRGVRGEYIPPFARLAIHIGQGDLPAIRRVRAKLIADVTHPASLFLMDGAFLVAFRSDPEIDRLLVEMYGR